MLPSARQVFPPQDQNQLWLESGEGEKAAGGTPGKQAAGEKGRVTDADVFAADTEETHDYVS
jgi:hypothetical protein